MRSYKDAWPVEQALVEIDAKGGTHFDPELLAAFHRGLPEIVCVKQRYPDELVPAGG